MDKVKGPAEHPREQGWAWAEGAEGGGRDGGSWGEDGSCKAGEARAGVTGPRAGGCGGREEIRRTGVGGGEGLRLGVGGNVEVVCLGLRDKDGVGAGGG